MKIAQLFRAPKSHFYSIEKVYNAIFPHFPDEMEPHIHYAVSSSADLKGILANWKFFRKLKADIYHITGEIYYTSLFFPGKKVVITIHDCNYVKRAKGWKKWVIKSVWLKWPVEHAQKIIAISNASKLELIEMTGCEPEKVVVIPNPIDDRYKYSERTFDSGSPRILQVGTRWNKNLERVIKALEGVNCFLHIIGPINESQKAMLSSLGIRYSQEENLPEEQMLESYRNCDILMFASLSEGFGLPILEAQAIGRPVITSNLSPMTEVAGKGALLVNPESVPEIHEAVVSLINDSKLRKRLIDEGLENVLKYRPSQIAGLYVDLYKNMSKVHEQVH